MKFFLAVLGVSSGGSKIHYRAIFRSPLFRIGPPPFFCNVGDQSGKGHINAASESIAGLMGRLVSAQPS